jgi:hypothetical protein
MGVDAEDELPDIPPKITEDSVTSEGGDQGGIAQTKEVGCQRCGARGDDLRGGVSQDLRGCVETREGVAYDIFFPRDMFSGDYGEVVVNSDLCQNDRSSATQTT